MDRRTVYKGVKHESLRYKKYDMQCNQGDFRCRTLTNLILINPVEIQV